MKIKDILNLVSIGYFLSFKRTKDKMRIGKRNKMNILSESGRSMTEMLTVLAIIVVLSILALFGYRYAMTKYIANETINELNLRAHDISLNMDKMIQNNYIGEIQMGLGPLTRMGYPITARVSPKYADYFEIFIQDVPTDVCKELLRMPWQSPYSIFVGIQEFKADIDICSQADKVELAYEFYKDLSPKNQIDEDHRHQIMRCHNENDCLCGDCNNEQGICESYCTDSEYCRKDYDDPRWMVCCHKNYIVGDYCCTSLTDDGKCCNREGKCCPNDKPLLDRYGTCHACDDINGLELSNPDTCSVVCPKRFISGKYCAICNKNEFFATNGRCYSCTDPVTGVQASVEECNKCADTRERNNWGDCYLKCNLAYPNATDTMIPNVFGECKSCNISEGIWLYDTRDYYKCDSCPNRKMDRSGGDGYCRKICTDPAKPLLATDGKCYPCDYDAAVYTTGLTDTCENLCPNRKTEGNLCKLISCATGKFMATNNKCYSCTDPVTGVQASVEECNKCADTRERNSWGDCYLKCNLAYPNVTDTMIPNVYGECKSCNISEGIWLYDTRDYYKCDSCPNRKMDRSGGNGYCIRIECPNTKQLEGTNGVCYPCNITTPILTDEEKCNRCINRSYQNGYCFLNS